jgi:hypothetical protein
MVWLLLFLTLVSSGCALLPRPAPRETAGTWTEYPGTKLGETGLVSELPYGGESMVVAGILDAWSSAAFDGTQLLLVRHGGHADTAHNGALALTLIGTPAWSLLKDTSRAYPPIPGPGPFGVTYADGSPASVHVYDCEAWLPTVRRVYSGGGIYWSPPGESQPAATWWFDPAAKAYERKANRPGGYGCATAWDATSGRLLMRTSSAWIAYDPATDAYQTLREQSAAGDSAEMSTLFLDGPGRRALLVYRGVPGVRVFNLAAPADEVVLATEGDTGVESLAGLGGAFAQGRVYAFGKTADGTRGALHVLDLSAPCGQAAQPKCRWTRVTPASGATPPAPHVNGVWKRAGIVGNRFYVLPASDANLWAFTMGPPPAGPYPVTLSATGTGAGTVGGAGSYAAGAPVTLTASPTAGDTFAGWGPAPCAPSFAMPAQALACAATFTAATPPPTPASAPTTAISGPDAQGRYTVTITQPDGKGNVATTDVRTVITAATAPIVTKYPLTISTAGSGTGTTTGAGSYDAGTVVALGGTAAADSTGPVWGGDPDCTDGSVTMTAARACIATFTKKATPPPTSSGWTPYPLWAMNQGPMTNPPGGKHARLTYDSLRKRMLLSGGDRDGSDGGNPSVWAFPVGGAAELLAPMCPAAPAWMPAFPDNVTWTYDSKRDLAYVMPGFFFDFTQTKAMCNREDDRVLKRLDDAGKVMLQSNGLPYKQAGVFTLTTKLWSYPPWPWPADGYGGDGGSNFGVYDPGRDQVVRFFWEGSHGLNLQRIALATNTWDLVPLGSGANDEQRAIANTGLSASRPALDVAKRVVYGIGPYTHGVQQPDGSYKDVTEWGLIRAHVETGVSQRFPMPAGFVGPNVGDGGIDILLTFLPKARRLVFVLIPNLCGDVSAVWTVDVDNGHRWDVVALPTGSPVLKGNVIGTDETADRMVLMGGHGCGLPDGSRTPNPTHYWTWGPGAAVRGRR